MSDDESLAWPLAAEVTGNADGWQSQYSYGDVYDEWDEDDDPDEDEDDAEQYAKHSPTFWVPRASTVGTAHLVTTSPRSVLSSDTPPQITIVRGEDDSLCRPAPQRWGPVPNGAPRCPSCVRMAERYKISDQWDV